MWRQMLPALRMTLLLTGLTGLLYPGVVTGVCQLLFPTQANGSLVLKNGRIVGSALIGQNFSRPEYFWPRPSAAGTGYDASISGGSNLGPTSQKLIDRVKTAAAKLPNSGERLPSDMLTASGSGLDPHVSPATAHLQAARVAGARAVPLPEVTRLVGQFIEQRDLSVFGEPRVNVLLLNLALDDRYPVKK